MPSKEIRIQKILPLLAQYYPDTTIALIYKSPFELIVATILSAQCTDEVVNRVTPQVFKHYPSPVDLAGAKQPDLEKLIHATGFFRNKAKNLIGMAQGLMERFDGQVPSTMEQLLTLPGVARKTANVVLQNAFQKTEGVVVDTHVRRISQRLGLTEQENPEKIEKELMDLLPNPEWGAFSIRLIFHGRKICDAKKPKCGDCSLAPHCPSAYLGKP